jgi:2,5-diamino-6-(ribosylamino)-4(3H)-pyrimidinone 5'-phosphate reductase
VLIGGKDTATLVDGASFTEAQQLSRLGILQLEDCIVLDDSYLHLRYRVIHREKDNGNNPSC